MNKTHSNIAFIGGGNMARSLIGGISSHGHPAKNIYIFDLNEDIRNNLVRDFQVQTAQSNGDLVSQCDIIVLAVKPQIMQIVCEEIKQQAQSAKPLFISIAAGITEHALDHWLGGQQAIVRCMPNTPALLQCGMTGLHANTNVSIEQKQLAETILSAVGKTLWVDSEQDIDAVTAISGSGPAYFFRIMESMIAAGIKLGMTEQQAQLLTQQTALGAARMVVESNESPAELRQKVTSPGGTTEQGLLQLEKNQIDRIFDEVLIAARDRAISLSAELEK